MREAISRGAAAVCSERPISACVPTVVLSDLRVRQGEIAARYFGDPSAALTCIGVTGTNGKTSVAYQLASLLDDAAYMGTIGWGDISRLSRSRLTTEDAVTVQRRLGALRGEGRRSVAMEVSSHALEQDRVAAVQFDMAVFTNLTRDHLDYHVTMERYAAAKRRLFEMPCVDAVIVNADDPFGRSLAAQAKVETIGYGESANAAVSWSDTGFPSARHHRPLAYALGRQPLLAAAVWRVLPVQRRGNAVRGLSCRQAAGRDSGGDALHGAGAGPDATRGVTERFCPGGLHRLRAHPGGARCRPRRCAPSSRRPSHMRFWLRR